MLADKNGQGGPLDAPDDGVVHPEDGSFWFTDPGDGGLMNHEGQRVSEAATSLQPFVKDAIYRIDGRSGKVAKVADQPLKSNGLYFSPDYLRLYVADTDLSHYPEAKPIIWAFDVDGASKNARTFANTDLVGKAGLAEGIGCDDSGNVWASPGWVGEGCDGVHMFSPEGRRIGRVRRPEVCANVCCGGSKRNRLFMTGSRSLHAVYVEGRGAHIT